MQGNKRYQPETFQYVNSSGAAASILIPTPGTDKRIVVHSVLSDTQGWLVWGNDNSVGQNGGKVCRVDNQGQVTYDIVMGEDKSLWKGPNLGGNLTVTYYII